MSESIDSGRPSPVTDDATTVAAHLSTAEGLLLCSDFDGTLAGITRRPEDAEIRPASRGALRRLRDHPYVELAVVSGRGLSDLRSRVDLEGIDYAGNHGLEIYRDGERIVHPLAARQVERIRAACDELDERLAGVEGCFVERKGLTATVHHRLADADRTDEIRETVEAVVSSIDSRIDCSTGKAVVEFGPDVPWDKGSAVDLLAADRPDGWLTLYLGDDTTDEDAFRRIRSDGLGVHVGDSPDTAASHRVDDPAAVEAFLDWLAETGIERL